MLLAAIAVLVAVFFAATGRGGELSREHVDHAPLELGAVTAADVALLRPPTAMWGYNVEVTDEALDRIARAMRDRDLTIAYLQQQLAAQDPVPGVTAANPVTPVTPVVPVYLVPPAPPPAALTEPHAQPAPDDPADLTAEEPGPGQAGEDADQEPSPAQLAEDAAEEPGPAQLAEDADQEPGPGQLAEDAAEEPGPGQPAEDGEQEQGS